MRKILLSLIATTTFATAPSLLNQNSADAQDDWNVRRNPFDKTLIARHKRALSKRPHDSGSLGKLMGMYRRYRSIGVLIREYEAAQAKKPNFSTLVVLGYLHQHEKKPKDARTFFQQAIKLKPDDSGLNLALGKLYRDDGDAKTARKHYAIALKGAAKKPAKMSILRALADLSITAGDITQAKSYFQQLIALDPKNLQTQLELADALVQFDRHDEAIVMYRAAESRLRSDPMMRIDVITRIGTALKKKGDDMAAVKEYQRGMKLVGRGYYLAKELTARIVEIYRQRQELDVLIAKFEVDWKAKARGHFEWDTLGQLYFETGKSDQAISAYRNAIKKAPYELDTHKRLIKLLENSGQEALALKQYEAVIRVAPGEPRFQLELAKRYWKNGDAKKAIAMAKKVDSHFSSDAGVVNALADLYSAWGKMDQALAAYQKLVRIEPGDSQHLENLGEQYFQRGDKKKAQQVWKKLMRIKNAESYGRLARVYAEHDLLPDSLVMFAKAIRLEPKKSALYKGRASVYERLMKWNESIADWEKVLALSPDKKSYESARREARRRVVNILERARGNKLTTRIAMWKASFAKTPPDISAGYYLVQAYNRLSKFKEMTTTLQRLRVLRPTDFAVMQQLVKAYRSGGQLDKAVTLLLKLAELSPGSERDYFNQIAEIKTELQQDGEAIEYVRRALEKSPNDPVAYQRLAERYQAMQKQSEAVKAYEKVIELSPRSFRIYFILARLHINSGERVKAAVLYRTILTKASDQEILRKAGQEAVELEWLIGSLAELERVVAPLVVAYAHKPIYRRILVKLFDRYVPQLAAQLRSPDQKKQKEARTELQRLGAHGLGPLLEALSDDSDVRQQEIAVSVLGYVGNLGAAAPLVRLAKTDSKSPSQTRIGVLRPTVEWKLRIDALIAAGRLGDPRTITDLILLSKHRERAMREAAIFALGMTQNKKALPALMATSDDSDSIQTLGCLGMAGINDKKVTEFAISVISNEEKGDLPRAACAWLVGQKRDRSAQDALIGALVFGNDETQRLSAWALGEIGDKRALSALMTAYFSKRAPVRNTTAAALALLLRKSSKPHTTRPFQPEFPMASQSFDTYRAVAALAPGPRNHLFDSSLLIGQEKHIALGLRASIQRHRDLILQALADLDAADDHVALGVLTKNMDTLSSAKRKALLSTLNRVATKLLPELTELTQHRDPEVRRRSLRILAKLGGDQAESLLHAAFSDTNLQVRQSAIESAGLLARLHGVNNQALTNAIIDSVSNRLGGRWQERVSATKALAHWPSSQSTVPLIQTLHTDAKGFVRTAAAIALGTMKKPPLKVIRALAQAANPESEAMLPVRLEAVRGLQSIGTKAAKEYLHKIATTDPSARIRRAAKTK